MKKILSVITSIVIGISITLLCVSFFLKSMLVTTISNAFTESQISSKIIAVVKNNISELTDYEYLEIEEELNNSPEMKSITDKYMKALEYDILNATNSEVDISEEVESILNRNLSTLNISNEIKDSIRNKVMSIKFSTIYDMVLYKITDGNQLSSSYKNVINIYEVVISTNMKIVLISVIVGNILLSLLINRSFLKLMNVLSTSLLISSMILFITNLVVFKFLPPLTYRLIGIPIDFAISPIVISNVVFFTLGIALNKIYDIVLNFRQK